jgi:hypothetical protein
MQVFCGRSWGSWRTESPTWQCKSPPLSHSINSFKIKCTAWLKKYPSRQCKDDEFFISHSERQSLGHGSASLRGVSMSEILFGEGAEYCKVWRGLAELGLRGFARGENSKTRTFLTWDGFLPAAWWQCGLLRDRLVVPRWLLTFKGFFSK